jgi:hypothetical protein
MANGEACMWQWRSNGVMKYNNENIHAKAAKCWRKYFS